MNRLNDSRWTFLNFYIRKVTEDKNYYDRTSGGDAFSSRFIMRREVSYNTWEDSMLFLLFFTEQQKALRRVDRQRGPLAGKKIKGNGRRHDNAQQAQTH